MNISRTFVGVARMKGLNAFLAVVVFLAIDSVEPSADVVKDFTIKFGNSLNDCLKELSLPASITDDFYSYWREDFTLTNRDTGCVIVCLAKKIGMHEDGKLHRENAKDFVMQHGADDALATQIVDIIHTCEKATSEPDECVRVLGIANCFKVEVHKLNWAPSPDLLAGQFVIEI